MDFLEKFDKQKLQKITLMVIAALTLLALILLLIIVISSVEGTPGPDNPDIPSINNNKNDLEFENMTVDASQLAHGSLVLVNGTHKYDIPSDLNLQSIYEYRSSHRGDTTYTYNLPNSTQKLESTTLTYAHEMLVDLGKATGNHSIMISSAFRTYDDQSELNSSIAAGYSDSHTGQVIALTVYKGVSPYLHDESNADLNNWLTHNCYKYGFVVRYPDDKAEITGVEDYSYAFRYVGIPHAKYMSASNICLEEYIEYLKENASYKKPLSVTTDDGSIYYVYYEALEGATGEIKVPIRSANPDGSMNFDYTISGTNDGGIVITVKVK